MSSTERILVIRLGALGDLVLCFQAFHEIRQMHPEAEIALLTMPAFADFARSMPWFNYVITDDRAPGWRLGRWARLINEIDAFAPGRVYDLQGKLRQSVLFALMGGPFGPSWSGAAPLCSDPRLWPPGPNMHFTEFIAAQLRRAGVPMTPPCDLSWLDAPAGQFNLPARYALLIPGSALGRDYKRWPAKYYAALAQKLAGQGITSVAAGTIQDAGSIATLTALMPQVVNLCGRTSLPQLAHLARDAQYVIGNDTGPVHLAAAVGARTLALMSDQVDPAWSAPRGPQAIWLQGKPLSELGVDKVLLALEKLIDRTG